MLSKSLRLRNLLSFGPDTEPLPLAQLNEMRRLRREDLATWLDKYRLGQLWTKGQLGGTRW
jgi:hypothetical protein